MTRSADKAFSKAHSKALILEPGSPAPHGEIGRLVAEELGLFPADAVARVRYGAGIVLRRVEEEVATSLARLLGALDVRARVVPAELLDEPSRGIRAIRLELLDGAVSAGLAGGREIVVLDADVRALGIHAQFLEPDASRDEPAAVPVFSAVQEGQVSSRAAKIMRWIEEQERGPLHLVLTVYTREVGPIRFEREGTDYSVLGEAKQKHSLDNFLTLVETLLARFDHLLNVGPVTGFLDRLDPGELLVLKREEVQNFDRWIQAWMRLEDTGEEVPGEDASGATGVDGVDTRGELEPGDPEQRRDP